MILNIQIRIILLICLLRGKTKNKLNKEELALKVVLTATETQKNKVRKMKIEKFPQ
jgi:hypothetical protein